MVVKYLAVTLGSKLILKSATTAAKRSSSKTSSKWILAELRQELPKSLLALLTTLSISKVRKIVGITKYWAINSTNWLKHVEQSCIPSILSTIASCEGGTQWQ